MPDTSGQVMGGALVVLRRAIHNELAGQRFYLDASFACIDPWAKEVFASLAKDEERHARLLILEHEAVQTRGHWIDPESAMACGAEPDITHIVFPEEASQTALFPAPGDPARVADRRSDDLDALAMGLVMEQQAIELYGRALETEQDLAAQQAYGFLIEEESHHYQQLKEQWERIAGIPFE